VSDQASRGNASREQLVRSSVVSKHQPSSMSSALKNFGGSILAGGDSHVLEDFRPHGSLLGMSFENSPGYQVPGGSREIFNIDVA